MTNRIFNKLYILIIDLVILINLNNKKYLNIHKIYISDLALNLSYNNLVLIPKFKNG